MFIASVPDFTVVSCIFFLAGAVKGVLGMGLPTVAVGLLGLVMPVAQAASLLVVPSLATNAWQAGRGPHLAAMFRRLWTMQAGVVAGIAAGAQLMHAGGGRPASLLLGASLAAYGLAGLAGWRLPCPSPKRERLAGAVAGVATGVLTAATGVFVLPAVPYLQALSLDKDEMAQALGISFTVATLALGVALIRSGSFAAEPALQSLIVLVPALAGMWLGQRLRDELSQQACRRLLFAGLLALGLWLLGRHT